MEEKQVYKCAYCGTEYDTPAARGRCEMECDMKRQQKAERERKEELERQKENRRKEIVSDYKALREKCDAFAKDYGEPIRINVDWDKFYEPWHSLLSIL